MARSPRSGYAQARIQARHGDRATPELWRRLATSRDLGHFLQIARASILSRWVRQMASTDDGHSIERRLRGRWRHAVAEVAAWQEPPWQSAVNWLAILPYLEPVQHLMAERPVQAWMRADPVLAGVTSAERLPAAEPMDPAIVRLMRGCASGQQARDVWVAQWRMYWPPVERETRQSLQVLEAELASHLGRVEDAPVDTPSISLRQDLEALFIRLMRRSARTAVSAFAYLGLVALDLERLRWGLARRCAFPSVRGLSRWD